VSGGAGAGVQESCRALRGDHHKLFQTQLGADHVLVTERERSFVDCLLFPDYSGGAEELDKSLAMFPSFAFDAALEYLKEMLLAARVHAHAF